MGDRYVEIEYRMLHFLLQFHKVSHMANTNLPDEPHTQEITYSNK